MLIYIYLTRPKPSIKNENPQISKHGNISQHFKVCSSSLLREIPNGRHKDYIADISWNYCRTSSDSLFI